ncbi:MAG: hypothetical protein ACE5G0_22875, partial [Rhodothermales bacterium]
MKKREEVIMVRDRRRFWPLLVGFLLLTQGTALGQECVDDVLCVITEKQGNLIRFYVDNLRPDDLIVTFDVEMVNFTAGVSFPYQGTYPGRQRTQAFSLRKNRQGAG